MAMIRAENVSFTYPGSLYTIFSDVNFTIDTDWKLGFIGRNGRGKTTFLKMLLGQLEYQGTITTPVPMAYFPYVVENKSYLTIDVALELREEIEEWQIRKELGLLNVDADDVLYRPFETLSNGEQTKVLLAVLFAGEERFLLIDEPTNHLDAEARAVVGAYLNTKKGFILVSHDRAFLDSCIDHVLVLNRETIVVQQGNFSTWWQNYTYQQQHEQAQNEKLKKEITRLGATARRTAGWSDAVEKTKYGTWTPDSGFIGAKSAKMMKRAKVVENRQQKALAEKKELLKDAETRETLVIKPKPHHQKRYVVAENLCVQYGSEPVFSNMDFTVEENERVVLSGSNGSGKSSILKLICGQEIPHTGTLQIASGLSISYVPQDTSFLSGDLQAYAKQMDIDIPLYLAILRKMGFERSQFEVDMSSFSSGQKKKVLIAASLATSANLYVWDEPLNFIDVYARIQIEELIVEGNPTMVFVEHDKAFCDLVATKSVCL